VLGLVLVELLGNSAQASAGQNTWTGVGQSAGCGASSQELGPVLGLALGEVLGAVLGSGQYLV